MKPDRPDRFTAFLLLLFVTSALASAQVTRADYERATGLRAKLQPLALNIVDRGGWIAKSARYWYRKSVAGGTEYWIADASNATKTIAFDHARLAAGLAAASGEKIEAFNLPFFTVTFTEDGKSVEFAAAGARWSCDLSTYVCKKLEGPGPRGPRGGGMTMWERGPAPEAASRDPKTSPDGKWEAFIRNYNVVLRDKEKKDETILSRDGSEGNYYTNESLRWSPDSKKLVAFRLRRGYHRVIQYVESSPADQLQPKYHTMEYAKPGDALDIERPVLFLVEGKARLEVDDALFPNPYELTDLAWRKDSRAFTFEYNQRGHQVYRIVEVDAATGAARAIVEEKAETFFCYSGKKYRFDLADGREVVWMSERDGWNHLYLYDGATGAVKGRITTGEWVVRSVDKVDEEKRQVYFQASGVVPGEDPYFVNAFRVNLDGTGFVRLTEGEANHTVTYSPDHALFVDTWSRVDLAPTTEIRRVADKAVVMMVEKGDIGGLLKSGWRTPEVFVAKARDGQTDIWGVIIRPTNFDPRKKYPVIEYIYAGPQGSFVPKSFQATSGMRALAELGFIVSQCDGMGTSNRSKAFH
ncbi:MAG: S9 family peptidase, partial [Candidatus Aminicenantes bacterium]|nr:S9 family peptidase [Candidatus Aminicenantes bacterium]